MLKHLPNLLTGLRLLLAPAAAWCAWRYWEPTLMEGRADWAYWGAGMFVAAALTDLFDGWAARALKAESRLGRIMDPIADKLLVGLPLIVLSIQLCRADAPFWLLVVLCTAVIVGRDVGITLLRILSPDGEGVRVSSLAKWKTALELLAVGAVMLAAALAARFSPPGHSLVLGDAFLAGWLTLLSAAAALSAWTGAAYLKPVLGLRK